MVQELLLESAWRALILDEAVLQSLAQVDKFLVTTRADGTAVYPEPAQFFNALNALSPALVKVVILGQDPYHGDGLANGFAFSVPQSVNAPPSLRNILIEVQRDLGLGAGVLPQRDLMSWVGQGVLLLNTVLSVSAGAAGSHQHKGWESFTDAVMAHLGARAAPTVFMLWGKAAQRKAGFIQQRHHLVLTAPHPSPLSVYRGFSGCGHFSKCNQFLKEQGVATIDW